jgi:hypothetical protein
MRLKKIQLRKGFKTKQIVIKKTRTKFDKLKN